MAVSSSCGIFRTALYSFIELYFGWQPTEFGMVPCVLFLLNVLFWSPRWIVKINRFRTKNRLISLQVSSKRFLPKDQTILSHLDILKEFCLGWFSNGDFLKTWGGLPCEDKYLKQGRRHVSFRRVSFEFITDVTVSYSTFSHPSLDAKIYLTWSSLLDSVNRWQRDFLPWAAPYVTHMQGIFNR